MTVRAKHGALAARRDAGFDLLNRGWVVLAENFSLRFHRQIKLEPMEQDFNSLSAQ